MPPATKHKVAFGLRDIVTISRKSAMGTSIVIVEETCYAPSLSPALDDCIVMRISWICRYLGIQMAGLYSLFNEAL